VYTSAEHASGYNHQKDREQIVRATVGGGGISVRDDAKTGADWTVSLNRDVSQFGCACKADETPAEIESDMILQRDNHRGSDGR
jgi:hypothetical protein